MPGLEGVPVSYWERAREQFCFVFSYISGITFSFVFRLSYNWTELGSLNKTRPKQLEF